MIQWGLEVRRRWVVQKVGVRCDGGMSGPTKRGVAQGGYPTSLELGAGGVEVALARGQTKAGSHPDDLA